MAAKKTAATKTAPVQTEEIDKAVYEEKKKKKKSIKQTPKQRLVE